MKLQMVKRKILTASAAFTLAATMFFSGAYGDMVQVRAAETKEDYYVVAVSQTAQQVEAFALTVKANILAQDWQALSEQIEYPVRVGKKEYGTAEEFLVYANSGPVRQDFLDVIQKEKCKKMFCNYQGVMFGDGQVWFSERIEGSKRELKVISMDAFVEEPETLEKPKKISWKKAAVQQDGAVGIQASWKKVQGAEGYQCRFYLFWPDDKQNYSKVSGKKKTASVYFQDHGSVKLKVRAYKVVDGKKVYGKWATSVVNQAEVDALLAL